MIFNNPISKRWKTLFQHSFFLILVLFGGCKKDTGPSPLRIITSDVLLVTSYFGVSGGTIEINPGAKIGIIYCGVCWNTSPSPDTSDFSTKEPYRFLDKFNSKLRFLEANTKYYIRAYVVSTKGLIYGDEKTFITNKQSIFSNGAGVTDIDGNQYKSFILNGQEWMKENLKTTRYRDGSAITTGLSDTAWQNTKIGSYSVYENKEANNDIYGKLYNFYAVADPRGLCPAGWHVPSDEEWKSMESILGMTAIDLDLVSQYRGNDQNVGDKLKAVSNLWNPEENWATDESGFSGLPGGARNSLGGYSAISYEGIWWPSTESFKDGAWCRNLVYNGGFIGRLESSKRNGFSVRCIKD